MSYTPTEWHTGDIVTANKLNNLEQGVVDAQLPEYSASDKGKVLTVVEQEGETIVVVPEQEVDGIAPLVGVTLVPADIPLGTTGVFTSQEGAFDPVIVDCVFQYDSQSGIYGFWTDESPIENYVVVYDDNTWYQAISEGLVTVSLTVTNTYVEPKWGGGGIFPVLADQYTSALNKNYSEISAAVASGLLPVVFSDLGISSPIIARGVDNGTYFVYACFPGTNTVELFKWTATSETGTLVPPLP